MATVMDQWIECSLCKKWRKCSQQTLDDFPDDEKWYCKYGPAFENMRNPCSAPQEIEGADAPAVSEVPEFVCQEILWEQWVCDLEGSQRQYRVEWTTGKKDTVLSDPHDEQWPACMLVWKKKCENMGDEFPMPCPDMVLTEKAKEVRRQYNRDGTKRILTNRNFPPPKKQKKKVYNSDEYSEQDDADEDEYWKNKERERMAVAQEKKASRQQQGHQGASRQQQGLQGYQGQQQQQQQQQQLQIPRSVPPPQEEEYDEDLE